MTSVTRARARKAREIWSVAPSDSVRDALSTMAAKEAGALVVLEDGRLVGIPIAASTRPSAAS